MLWASLVVFGSFGIWELHCKVKINNSFFILSAFYGSPRFSIRKHLWSSLFIDFKDFSLFLGSSWAILMISLTLKKSLEEENLI